jgi:Tfp pilus assembly protein PilF
LSTPDSVATDQSTILRIIQAAKAAGAEGRSREAEELLARAAQLAPEHPAVLNEQGLQLMQRGDAAGAGKLFQRATAADPRHPALWSNLAVSLDALGMHEQAMEAVERALAIEPRHPAALLQKAALIERRGDRREAARVYRAALVTLGPETAPPPSLRPALERAREAVRQDDAALARAIEERLAPLHAPHGSGVSRRAQQCIELLTGRRNRYMPQPTFMYFPGTPALEFFDNAELPWLGALEAATDAIRAELTEVLASDRAGLEPYVAYPDGVPLDQWRELNRSRRWSAYFLWNQGVAQSERLARCPRTAAAVEAAPRCNIAQHGPNVFFSILEPHTRICRSSYRGVAAFAWVENPANGFQAGRGYSTTPSNMRRGTTPTRPGQSSSSISGTLTSPRPSAIWCAPPSRLSGATTGLRPRASRESAPASARPGERGVEACE